LREQLLLGVGALRPALLHEIRSANGLVRTGCERQALHRRTRSEPDAFKGWPMRRHRSAQAIFGFGDRIRRDHV
jgi:hypothetical protein